MKLLLVRHGNTFEPGDPVVWAGLTNDLPLAEKGWEQASEVGRRLASLSELPVAVFSSGLQRCEKFASHALAEISSSAEPLPEIVIDPRLNELDYGAWTGKTNAEVDTFDAEAQAAWNARSEWPTHVFSSTEAEVKGEVLSFAAELKQKYSDTPDAVVVLVSSNGRLRYFLNLVEGAFEKAVSDRTFKVGTGHTCLLELVDGEWQIRFWNMPPEEITL